MHIIIYTCTQENNDGHGPDTVPYHKTEGCYSQDWLELILMMIFVWTGRRWGGSFPEPFCEPCGSTAGRDMKLVIKT